MEFLKSVLILCHYSVLLQELASPLSHPFLSFGSSSIRAPCLCNTLQHTLQYTAILCNTLQHHRNTSTTHCVPRPRKTCASFLLHTATHTAHTPQHTLQHAASPQHKTRAFFPLHALQHAPQHAPQHTLQHTVSRIRVQSSMGYRKLRRDLTSQQNIPTSP